MSFRRQRAVVALLTIGVTACSSLSVGNLFSHYSAQNRSVYQQVRAGLYAEAANDMPDSVAGDILDNMERGRVAFLSGDYGQSKRDFEVSERAVRIQQDQAQISLSENLNSAGSLAINDNLASYHPADYELGFLHLYLGLNYLQENSLEGALVEARKANQVQERARKRREKVLADAEQELKRSGLEPNLGAVLSRYPDAGDKLQATQNGYLLYLSALLYEAANELNSAIVDYKRALAVQPDNEQVIQGAMRVARRIGLTDDLKQLIKQYGRRPAPAEGQGRIIVLDEQGVVSARQGWKLSLPLYLGRDWAYYSMALPYYPTQAVDRFAKLTVDGQPLAQSQLVDVNLMAQQDLTERMPNLLIRQALRVITKDQLRQVTTKEDELGGLLVDVWNVFTEQPDTRSWQTLPAEVYSSSQYIEAGEHLLSVAGQAYPLRVTAGNTLLVWISRQGNNATIWHKQLGRL